MHRNVAIRDYRSLVTQTSGMDICQIGYDICEFDSLRGLEMGEWEMIRILYEIFIPSCTDNIYDLENERWLLGDMIDHVGIYGSRVAEGLSAFYVGLVIYFFWWLNYRPFNRLISNDNKQTI